MGRRKRNVKNVNSISQEQSKWFKARFPYSYRESEPEIFQDLKRLLDIMPTNEKYREMQINNIYYHIIGGSLSPFELRRESEQLESLVPQVIEQFEEILTIDSLEIKNYCLMFKRSMAVGYSDMPPLFFKENTQILFGDAKEFDDEGAHPHLRLTYPPKVAISHFVNS